MTSDLVVGTRLPDNQRLNLRSCLRVRLVGSGGAGFERGSGARRNVGLAGALLRRHLLAFLDAPNLRGIDPTAGLGIGEIHEVL